MTKIIFTIRPGSVNVRKSGIKPTISHRKRKGKGSYNRKNSIKE